MIVKKYIIRKKTFFPLLIFDQKRIKEEYWSAGLMIDVLYISVDT